MSMEEELEERRRFIYPLDEEKEPLSPLTLGFMLFLEVVPFLVGLVFIFANIFSYFPLLGTRMPVDIASDEIDEVASGPVKKLVTVVNPKSFKGRKHANILAQTIKEYLSQAKCSMKIIVSQQPGHVRKIAAEMTHDTCDGIICVGGDGTVSEVVRGLREAGCLVNIPVGILPAGKCNTLAAHCGVLERDVTAGVRAALHGHLIPLTLMTATATAISPLSTATTATSHTFSAELQVASSVGWGLTSDMLVRWLSSWPLIGRAALSWRPAVYHGEVLFQTPGNIHPKPTNLRSEVAIEEIQIGEGTWFKVRGPFMLVQVLTTCQLSGSLSVTSAARHHKQAVTLTFAWGQPTRSQAWSLLSALTSGSPSKDHPLLTTLVCKRVRIVPDNMHPSGRSPVSVDGEVLGYCDIDIVPSHEKAFCMAVDKKMK